MEIIGEAAKQISDSLKKKYTSIPWKEIMGMRDKLIHHYFGVDLDLVWDTIKKDLPKLEKDLIKILKKEKKV